MARQTGASTIFGFEEAVTFDTAVVLGASDGGGFDSLTHGENVTELSNSPLGTGQSMLTGAEQGAKAPGGTVESKPTFNDATAKMIATFFGVSAAGVEQNGGEADFLHQMNFGETLKFGTLAFESTTTTVIEYPSTYPTTFNVTTGDIPGYIDVSLDWVSGDRDLSSSTNTNATMASVTIPDQEQIVLDHDSQFLINTQSGGALTNPTDCISIVSYALTLARPKSHVREIKCTSGLSAPIADGLFEGELTVTFSGLDDHSNFTSAAAGSEFKASLIIEGTQIGAGDNKKFEILLPRMKIIQDPEYNVSDPGENPHSVTYRLLAATAAPTGMSFDKPYVEYINDRSAAYIA